MPNVHEQRFVEHAVALLRRGQGREAEEFCRQALENEPSSARAHRVLGVAQGRQGRLDEALATTRRATLLDPLDPVAWANLAMLFVNSGQNASAVDSAKRALSLRPKDNVYAKLMDQVSAGSCRLDLDPGPIHVISWVEEAGRSWTATGWALAGLACVTFVSNLLLRPLSMGQLGHPTLSLHRDPLSVAIVFLTVVVGVGAFLWMTIDLLDRRGRIVWVLPMFLFAFVGLPLALPLAMYMWAGRR